jgi:hypothetical protein
MGKWFWWPQIIIPKTAWRPSRPTDPEPATASVPTGV